MMNSTLKSLCNLYPGTIIEGKWHHNRYTIIREIGYGANGVVYLAQIRSQKVALKMSDNGMTITSEVNVLKSFAKVQGSSLGPFLIDVDDWERGNGNISFYVMEYIEGPNLLSFIDGKGKAWVEVLILQLLNDLHSLHEKGWVFGDLKPENLIVMGPPPRIRCIDVGGTTIQGRAIKEFTEFYDRGYWGLGSRKAEPTYDLFAVAMIMMCIEYPQTFSKKNGGFQELRLMIQQKPVLIKYEEVIARALTGNYASAKEMRMDMLHKMSVAPKVSQHTAKNPSIKAVPVRKRRRKSRWMETMIILMIISFFYIMYIYGLVS